MRASFALSTVLHGEASKLFTCPGKPREPVAEASLSPEAGTAFERFPFDQASPRPARALWDGQNEQLIKAVGA